MQRSFIEKVFPKPRKALLPQYDSPSTYRDEPSSRSSERAASRSNTSDSRSSARAPVTDQTVRSAPLNASVIHHEDPFIAVDRAAQNLQRTIQSLLDFQSEALSGRLGESRDSASQRSPTPTQTATTESSRILSVPGAIPIRQPVRRKTTLRGARKGIGKSIHDFAVLKEEDLKITNNEQAHRRTALEKINELEAKRESVQHEISTLQERASEDESSDLRQEAQAVQNEIHELEGQLMELKAKHRHLVDRAEQLENSAASQLSSYQGALTLIDTEIRSFLRRPPLKQGLGPGNLQQGQDMYSLRPERRTLNIAREQWIAELETLEQHQVETEREKDALIEGAKLWQETVQKIDEFEQGMRARIKSSPSDPASTTDIVNSLDATVQFLEESLGQAEKKDWKLLICAIGPELQSFRQARSLLAPDSPTRSRTEDYDSEGANGAGSSHSVHAGDEDSDVPHADLLGERSPGLSFRHSSDARTIQDEPGFPTTTSSNTSNESLKATLQNVASGSTRQQPSFNVSTGSGKLPERRGTRYSESEDDDPGPDFLLSRP